MTPKPRSELQLRYSKPLPIEIIRLPELIPHNPLSWLIVIYSFISQMPKIRANAVEITYENFTFVTQSDTDIKYLWNFGFFGKGVLSRSEPTWLERTERRLLNIDDQSVTSEEIVKYRRKIRSEFKAERKKLDELEKTYKALNNVEKLRELEVKRHELTEQHNLTNKAHPESSKQTSDEVKLRFEDKEIINGDNSIQSLEYLELMPMEALFLLIIDSIKIKNKETDYYYQPVELFKRLSSEYGSIRPDNKFVVWFVVYYHYRSLGWCVKSGLKFSSDFILYERGPPFQHAEFTINILLNNEERDWKYYASISRVVGVVKKSMIITYVEVPETSEFNILWDSLKDGDLNSMFELLKSYQINEIIYKRWSPSRTRE